MMPKRTFDAVQYGIIFRGQRMLLLRDNHTEAIRGFWVFPGGHVDDSEKDALKALAREIKEETNLRLEKAEPFAAAIKRYPSGRWKFVVYYKCRASGKIKLDHESSAYKWASLTDARKMKFRDAAERKLILQLLGSGK